VQISQKYNNAIIL